MKKFMVLYNGPATPGEQMSKEQSEKVMNAWREWMDNVGEALVDIGQPMANGHVVVDDGSEGAAIELSGYSIVQAEGMDSALDLVSDHPFLSDRTGDFSVEVFELLPVPM